MVFDDEPDERRREKFSRERGGGQDFRRSFERPKRDYTANGAGAKRAYRGVEEEQPIKRGRFDGAAESYEPAFNRREQELNVVECSALMTFKKFLATQDESLSDEDAIAKYKDYKTEFLRKEFEGYFQAHKEEEWFRLKYHPEEGRAKREEHRTNIQNRLEVFMSFMNSGRFNDISLVVDKAESIIRLMDSVVVKFEGGTDADIEAIKNELIEDESLQDLLKLTSAVPAQGEITLENRRISTDGNSEASGNQKVRNEGKSLKTSDEEGGTTTAEETDAMDADQSGLNPLVVSNKHQMDQTQKDRQLHKNCSIHLRTVPAGVPYTDLENLCKQHPGFLRLAISDPFPDSRGVQMRTAWVTYRRDVNIKEIFWALRSTKLMGSDLGAVVNRDLKRRVRVFGDSPFDSHRPVAANALRQAARLIILLDAKEGFYREELEAEEGEEEGGTAADNGASTGVEASKLVTDLDGAVLRSQNPVFSGITDYMVEESSTEEDALLERAAAAAAGDGMPVEITQQLEDDHVLTQALDRLVLYLRIVHSVDLYGAVQYPQEDQMPNRLGLIHVRGPSSLTKNTNLPPQLAKNAVDAYIQAFNARLEAGLFRKCTPLPEQELQKLGKKNAEKAAEEFVNANTQQLGADKWLCPLSGKKFKGPEFVHKHISTKYKDEIDKVRYEALYFNNYIADPNRPHNPQLFSATTKETKPVNDHRPSAGGDELRPRSPTTMRERVDHGGSDSQERTVYQRPTWNSGGFGNERFSGGSGQPRYSGGGGRSTFGGGGWRAPPGRMEPMNETSMRGMQGGMGLRDPRAPPSYKDLDAPTDDII